MPRMSAFPGGSQRIVLWSDVGGPMDGPVNVKSQGGLLRHGV